MGAILGQKPFFFLSDTSWFGTFILSSLCQGVAQKFFRIFDTGFVTKMMVKSGAIEIIFKSHKLFQSYLLTGQAQPAFLAESA